MLPGCVPWPEEFAHEYRRKGYWLDLSIPQVFARIAGAAPDRLAVVDGDCRMSLGMLWEQSGRLAAHFRSLGLRPRQRAVFQLPNKAEFPIAFLALLRAGVIRTVLIDREAIFVGYGGVFLCLGR